VAVSSRQGASSSSVRGILSAPPWLRWWAIGNGVVASLLAWIYVTRGTLNITREDPRAQGTAQFFSEQLQALLQGRADVPPSSLVGECWYVGEKCYGYFGLTGSLLRIPFVGLNAGSYSLTPIFLWAGVSLGIAASLVLLFSVQALALRGHALRNQQWNVLVAAAATGMSLGSLLLLDLRPLVFNEAIVWSSALTCSGLVFILFWRATARPLWLGWAGIALVLAANSRPTAAVTACALGLWVIVVGWSAVNRRATVLLSGGLIAVVPLLSLTASYMWKFGRPTPPIQAYEQITGAPWWADIMEANGGRFSSLAFAPTGIAHYLRPDALQFDSSQPLLVNTKVQTGTDVVYLWPLQQGSMLAAHPPSLTAVVPWTLLLLGAALIWIVRRPRSNEAAQMGQVPGWQWGALILAAGTGTALVLMNVALIARYLVDFWPALTLGAALGVVALSEFRVRTMWAWVLSGVTLGAVGYSVIVINALALQVHSPVYPAIDRLGLSAALQERGIACLRPWRISLSNLPAVSEQCQIDARHSLETSGLLILAESTYPQVRRVMAESVDSRVLAILSADADLEVRLNVAKNPDAPSEALANLAGGSDDMRLAVAGNRGASPGTLALLARDQNALVRGATAGNFFTPAEAFAVLARDGNDAVRMEVARNVAVPKDVLQALTGDPNPDIRVTAVQTIELKEE